MKRSSALLLGITSLMASGLACRPVLAIGWTELAIILVISLITFGPLLFRLVRFFKRDDESDRKQTDKVNQIE